MSSTLHARTAAALTQLMQASWAASQGPWMVHGGQPGVAPVLTASGHRVATLDGRPETAWADGRYLSLVAPGRLMVVFRTELERLDIHRPVNGTCYGPHGMLADNTDPCPEVRKIARAYGVPVEEPVDATVTMLLNGQTIHSHGPSACVRPCPLHHPTGHHMRLWPLTWNPERDLLMRLCPDGCAHPDPDDIAVWSGRDSGAHPCDGCCTAPTPTTARR